MRKFKDPNPADYNIRLRAVTEKFRQPLKEAQKRVVDIDPASAYVEGALFDDYIHDMKIVQRFAVLSRKAMIDEIVSGMGWHVVEQFTTIHNYIDT